MEHEKRRAAVNHESKTTAEPLTADHSRAQGKHKRNLFPKRRKESLAAFPHRFPFPIFVFEGAAKDNEWSYSIPSHPILSSPFPFILMSFSVYTQVIEINPLLRPNTITMLHLSWHGGRRVSQGH